MFQSLSLMPATPGISRMRRSCGMGGGSVKPRLTAPLRIWFIIEASVSIRCSTQAKGCRFVLLLMNIMSRFSSNAPQLMETKGMEVYLSIDGSREMHNRNRSNSYDLIDTGFFLRHFPFAKMTVSLETLPHLADGVIALHEMGFEVSSNLGHGVPWTEDCPVILAQQLQKLTDYYLAHPELTPSTILRLGIQDLTPGTKTPRRFCGVGPMMRSYDTDGSAYPCHAGTDLRGTVAVYVGELS